MLMKRFSKREVDNSTLKQIGADFNAYAMLWDIGSKSAKTAQSLR